ncbi:hypothetical protein DFR76_10962 [Nocardia pseudobrasiliensis]|uniref:Uncharacterized protein n=1 Tax=Nocardia pseudobrasiliensis TaxID=45979 RepID=A0A370HZ04_9NOCA|nr:hypothetical protein DFR76_10962 [Nocardia pseudobrasiliensis]
MAIMRGVCEHTEGKHLTVNAFNAALRLQRAFDGKFVDDIPAFAVLGARVEVPDLEALRGARRFTGTVGPTTLALTFDGDTRLSGSLVPALDREYSVEGEGYWRPVF